MWFWIFAAISSIGYTLNAISMAHFSRNIPPFSSGVYRNLGLGLSFAPLIFWIGIDAYVLPLSIWGIVVISSLITVITLYSDTKSMSTIPVGIFMGARTALMVLFTSIFTFFFFEETLSIKQIFWIALAVIGVLILSLSQPQSKHLPPSPTYKKVFILLVGTIAISISLPMMANQGDIAKTIHPYAPLAIAHIWEFMIGVWGLLFLFFRKTFTGKAMYPISGKTFLKMLLFSSPTVLGTGGYALAATHGDISVLTATGVSVIAFTALLGAIIFHEKLKPIQILSMGIIMFGIAGLALWS